MARHLDVSLSGYYSWKDRKEQRQKEVDEYKKMIKTIFQESNGTYGVDRICGELRKRGKIASYHRVKRFMDDMGLHSIHKRRRQRTLTDSRRARGDEYVNLVKDLEITEPFQVVSSDISYIRTMRCPLPHRQTKHIDSLINHRIPWYFTKLHDSCNNTPPA